MALTDEAPNGLEQPRPANQSVLMIRQWSYRRLPRPFPPPFIPAAPPSPSNQRKFVRCVNIGLKGAQTFVPPWSEMLLADLGSSVSAPSGPVALWPAPWPELPEVPEPYPRGINFEVVVT